MVPAEIGNRDFSHPRIGFMLWKYVQIIPVSLVHRRAQRFVLKRAFQNGQYYEKFSKMDKNKFSRDHHVNDHFRKKRLFFWDTT